MCVLSESTGKSTARTTAPDDAPATALSVAPPWKASVLGDGFFDSGIVGGANDSNFDDNLFIYCIPKRYFFFFRTLLGGRKPGRQPG